MRFKMFAPALMIKITEPSGELYEIRAISDEEVLSANKNFIAKDLPFRVCRPGYCSHLQHAA